MIVVPCWAGLVSAICLGRFFVSSALTFADLGLIFASSFVAGAVVGDLENAIVAFIFTLLVSVGVVGFVLSLPSILGIAGPVWELVAEEQALGDVLKAFIPFGLVILLGGGILGSSLAERLRLG